MLTTCPECHTCFRVSQAQLDQRRGLVRCGRCSAVFNAYDTLLPELATPQPEEAAPPTVAAPPEGLQPAAPAPTTPGTPAEGPAFPAADQARVSEASLSDGDRSPAAWQRSPPQPTGLSETASPANEPVSRLPGGAPAETPDAILLRPLPTAHRRAPPGWRSALWLLASLLLTLTFLLQIAYFLRAEIAAGWPQTRPYLELACTRLGCSLPLPRDVTALRFDASSLETDPEDASRATLRVSLSNRSQRHVAWPHLILILTDVRDLPIAQRPFPPSEYLSDAGLEARGLAPGQEREIRLDLELKGLTAYGYKLDKEYP
jgi:predicted Zn finger-like uncharacterized protein